MDCDNAGDYCQNYGERERLGRSQWSSDALDRSVAAAGLGLQP
jgi:hypothetical protein